jgi:hypothetical protein
LKASKDSVTNDGDPGRLVLRQFKPRVSSPLPPAILLASTVGVRVHTSKEIHTPSELSAAAGGSVVRGFAKGDPACAKQSSSSNKKEYVRFARAE